MSFSIFLSNAPAVPGKMSPWSSQHEPHGGQCVFSSSLLTVRAVLLRAPPLPRAWPMNDVLGLTPLYPKQTDAPVGRGKSSDPQSSVQAYIGVQRAGSPGLQGPTHSCRFDFGGTATQGVASAPQVDPMRSLSDYQPMSVHGAHTGTSRHPVVLGG